MKEKVLSFIIYTYERCQDREVEEIKARPNSVLEVSLIPCDDEWPYSDGDYWFEGVMKKGATEELVQGVYYEDRCLSVVTRDGDFLTGYYADEGVFRGNFVINNNYAATCCMIETSISKEESVLAVRKRIDTCKARMNDLDRRIYESNQRDRSSYIERFTSLAICNGFFTPRGDTGSAITKRRKPEKLLESGESKH